MQGQTPDARQTCPVDLASIQETRAASVASRAKAVAPEAPGTAFTAHPVVPASRQEERHAAVSSFSIAETKCRKLGL